VRGSGGRRRSSALDQVTSCNGRDSRSDKVHLNQEASRIRGDLRKFCEQIGDILQWDQSNKNYIMTHGVSGVDWRFYKSPRPEPVYDIYMQYWGDVKLAN
jgi:hypothetical protein